MFMICLAFVSGCIGTLIGGTQCFIIYGILGMFYSAFLALGVDTTWFNQYIMSFFFLPAVIFNATVPATAYAARKYDIKGYNIARSLAFTKDPIVILIGGLGGVCGYLLFTLATQLKLPMDLGAFSVIILGVVTRLLFNKGNQYNRMGVNHVRYMPIKSWGYEILIAVMISIATAFFVKETNNVNIGFYISAALLLFQFFDNSFPTTHQISMVAGYAILRSNIIVAVIFGVIAHIIFLVFAEILNSDCGTHIDPPAIAIGLCSLILFIFF